MISKADIANMDYGTEQLVVAEALLRRACEIDIPFALKGSLLTIQFFPVSLNRDIEDIDFLYLEKINDNNKAKNIFNECMTKVTDLDFNDGVKFRSFSENAFWRGIDYAMDDDFPTVNTDIAYVFTCISENFDKYDEISLDISYNLDTVVPPVPLTYKPVFGHEFVVPYTIPLAVQVAWKLHQTIVRPRFKDLYDLKFLMAHPSYDRYSVKETLRVLSDECKHDKAATEARKDRIFSEGILDIYKEISNDYYWRKYLGRNANPEECFYEFAKELNEIMYKVGLIN